MADTKKKTASKSTASKSTENARRIEIPSQIIDLQKRVVNGQRALFDTTYGAVSALQDNQAKAWNTVLERAPFVPEQAREIAQAWSDNRRAARESYKAVVDQSFALYEEWVDGLGGSRA